MDAASRPGSGHVHQPKKGPSGASLDDLTLGVPRADFRHAALNRFFLIFYNASSVALWSFLLYNVQNHLKSPSSAPGSLSSLLGNTQLGHLWPALIARAKTLHSSVGDETRLVQSYAILDVIFSLVGLTRSGTGTVAAQVFSRLVLVWGILIQAPEVRTSPFFASMVIAWSLAEIIKYATYTFSLMGLKIAPLEWLR